MTQFRDSTVLITGAASGIGRLMALGAARRGARIVAWDTDGPGLQTIEDDLQRIGAEVWTYAVDVTDRDRVYETADQVMTDAGTVEILILNAGVVSGRRFLDLPDEAIQRVMDVNVMGLFWCTKAFLPAMVAADAGHIVTIASAAGATPLPGLTDYVASKHAAYGFAETLRTELGEDAPGVRTTVVLPQAIDTGMFEGVTAPRLFPLVDPQSASDKILDAVAGDRQRLLLNRPALVTAYLLRAFPPRVSDWVARATGAFEGMTTFRGRSIIDERHPSR